MKTILLAAIAAALVDTNNLNETKLDNGYTVRFWWLGSIVRFGINQNDNTLFSISDSGTNVEHAVEKCNKYLTLLFQWIQKQVL